MVSSLDIERVFSGGDSERKKDLVPIEAPLEMLLYSHDKEDYQRLTVFMRTPQNDFDLVVGFLFTEQIIKNFSEVEKVFYCKKVDPERYGNTIKVLLKPHVEVDALLSNKRHFITSSSCGICGGLLLEKLALNKRFSKGEKFSVTKDVIFALAGKSLNEQMSFKYTGGVHASSLFSPEGELLSVKEDVGRHNALDKIIGEAVINDNLSVFDKSLLLLSGRVSYELIQKAAVAGIPLICALGAPSTLAVELSKELNIALAAFLNKEKFNIYTRSDRVVVLKNTCRMV